MMSNLQQPVECCAKRMPLARTIGNWQWLVESIAGAGRMAVGAVWSAIGAGTSSLPFYRKLMQQAGAAMSIRPDQKDRLRLIYDTMVKRIPLHVS